MRITGIIREYNPFHNGHKYHIAATRKQCNSDFIIGVMSGSFTQRGTPAIYDKYTRTKMALSSGCDLVIELPVRYATASAEGFAQASVHTLAATNLVDSMCFGTERGDLHDFYPLAKILNNEPLDYKQHLNTYLREGFSYPSARQAALTKYYLDNNITINPSIDQPNNILAVEYIRACLDTAITPFTIKREDHGYHNTDLSDTNSSFCSAQAIRHCLYQDDAKDKIHAYVPKSTYDLLDSPIFADDYSTLLYYALTMHADHLTQFEDISEDLARRIVNLLPQYQDWNQFVALIKTKQYTYTRVQRALLHCLLGIRITPKIGPNKYPLSYIRILGFRKSASKLIRMLNEQATLPVITKVAPYADLLSEDIRTTELYTKVKCTKYNMIQTSNEFTHGLIII